MKNLTSVLDFNREEYEELFRRIKIFDDGLAQGKNFTHVCPGKVIATMFFQESTRTAAGCQASMIKLGGGWFGIAGIKGTYLESGEEDLEDTLNGVAPLCDIMAIRSKDIDLSILAQKGFRVPLINAMSGSDEHTIGGVMIAYYLKKHFGKLEGLKLGFYGMGKSSRPSKAIVKLLSRYNVEIYEDSVIPEMAFPENIQKIITDNGSKYIQDKLANFINKVDFLMVVEGLPQSGEDPALVDKFNKVFVPFSNKELALLKDDACLMSGEPRATTDGRLVALKEIDNNPKVAGKDIKAAFIPTNMGIISYLLEAEVK